MKVYLINRADVQVFGREGLMKVFRDKNGEYIETGIQQESRPNCGW